MEYDVADLHMGQIYHYLDLSCFFSYHVQTDANYLLSDGYRPLW